MRREQLDSLTGLRGIAACWVMLMHFRAITPARNWEYPLFDTAIANGAYGVDVFFVLSGFILSHVYFTTFEERLAARDVQRFLLYRFARIYPVYFFTFVLMLALAGVSLIIGKSGSLPDRYGAMTWLTTLSLTTAWVPGFPTPNMPAWSVSAEWFAYLLFPALCLPLRQKWMPLLYLLIGATLAAFEALRTYDLTHVLSGFLIGMASYRLLNMTSRKAFCRYSGLFFALGIFLWAELTSSPPVIIGELLFACLIVALADQQDFLSRVLKLPLLLYLGEISYSLYMFHWPARVVVRNALQTVGLLDSLPSPLIVSGYVLVSFVAAAASYHFIELPGRALIRWQADHMSGWISMPRFLKR